MIEIWFYLKENFGTFGTLKNTNIYGGGEIS